MTNLKRIIDEKGVRQRWLAEQVGVTEVSMSRYVSGERIPKAPLAIRMADVLGVDVKELYGWDDKYVVGEPEQPETHEERTETHGVCLDVIDRQATLDWLKNEWNGMIASLFDGIKALPSAQADSKELSFTHKALDTISRKAAIDAHYEYCNKHPDAGFPVWSLKILEDLPSAQPETHEKRTETHACDCISRQAVISVIAKWMLEYGGEGEEHERNALKQAAEEIKDLPSAQPEIVQCKDCKHQVKEWRTDKRLKNKGYMVCGCEVVGDACGYWALLGQDDDYCSYAERKEQNVENS